MKETAKLAEQLTRLSENHTAGTLANHDSVTDEFVPRRLKRAALTWSQGLPPGEFVCYAVAEAARVLVGATKPTRAWSSRRAWTMAQSTSVGWQGEAIKSKAPW